jgi:glycosyltransferase involved in cell wall biosynthesis
MTEPGDADAMAVAIRAIADGTAQDTRRACHQFAASRFSWDRVLDEYVAIYRSLTPSPVEVPA